MYPVFFRRIAFGAFNKRFLAALAAWSKDKTSDRFPKFIKKRKILKLIMKQSDWISPIQDSVRNSLTPVETLNPHVIALARLICEGKHKEYRPKHVSQYLSRAPGFTVDALKVPPATPRAPPPAERQEYQEFGKWYVEHVFRYKCFMEYRWNEIRKDLR
jgi:hypothetical protein